ncbi:MAG: hypothetical protein M1608_07125 [Candidatus Omnitrophica bacterium]|nr:hypothetical protein [Candidatus Omnitrophota bacterium]
MDIANYNVGKAPAAVIMVFLLWVGGRWTVVWLEPPGKPRRTGSGGIAKPACRGSGFVRKN